MEYLLKLSVVIFIFYSFYKLFLQRETFFQTNRWYLLVGLIVATFLPLIIIPIYIEYIPSNIENLTALNTNIAVSQEGDDFSLLRLMFFAYSIGVTFFLGKLCLELTSLKSLFNKHHYFKHESFSIIETNEDIPPFSFFNWIVYNPNKYSRTELDHILNHEKVHAKELHSIDIIFAQLSCVILWFNPFIWLYKKEIQQNLEFIADNKAQDSSNCKKSYQLVLLKSSAPEHHFLITNNFYNSQIKKRIIMLHKSKSNKLNAWKYGLILPVLALFLMSFNTKKVFIELEDPSSNLEALVHNKTSKQLNEFYDRISHNTESNKQAEKATNTIPNKIKTTINPVTSFKSQKKNKIAGNISISLITKDTKDYELENIKNDLKKEGLIVKFKKVKRNNNDEITGIKIDVNSKTSNANYKVNSEDAISPIKIVFDEENNSISIGNSHSENDNRIHVYSSKNSIHDLHKSGKGSNIYVFKGDDHAHVNDDEHKHEHHKDSKIIINAHGKKVINSSSTEVHVISGKTDNDVLEIVMDKENDSKETIILNGKVKSVWVSEDDDNHDDLIILKNSDEKNNIFISNDENKRPLYIIDGEEVSENELVELKSDIIETVNIIKGKSAKGKYGDKGKDGVVIIKTKKRD